MAMCMLGKWWLSLRMTGLMFNRYEETFDGCNERLICGQTSFRRKEVNLNVDWIMMTVYRLLLVDLEMARFDYLCK